MLRFRTLFPEVLTKMPPDGKLNSYAKIVGMEASCPAGPMVRDWFVMWRYSSYDLDNSELGFDF